MASEVETKTAWVCSGGGARIIQQLDLIERHLDNGGQMPDLIVGTSAGGLLAILISHFHIRGAREEILKIQKRKDLFSSNFGFGWGKLGLWNAKPLQKLIQTIKDEKPAAIPYFVCAYNIREHRTVYFHEGTDAYWQAATACIPLLVEPVGPYIDGGITEGTPLKFPIDLGASEIEVFMCSADDPPAETQPGSKIEMALRCLDALNLEIARNDLAVCGLKNQLVKQPLARGKVYREINARLHVPKNNYIGVLEFERMRSVYAMLKAL
jgi:predicted acylesterase/phospholipase RssA